MQIRAIFECAAELIKAGKKCKPEIMVPVTCDVSELDVTRKIVDRVHAEVLKQFGIDGPGVHVRHDDRDPARRAAGRPDGEELPSSSPSAPTT